MWQTIFVGEIERRPVILKDCDDGDGGRELLAETTYGRG